MTAEKPKKPFALDQGKTTFTMRDVEKMRDQDNAKLVPPPPPIFRLDHPRLAPPGMKGITRTAKAGQDVNINVNVNVRLDQPTPRRAPSPQQSEGRVQVGDQDNAKRAFKPIARKLPGKGHEWER